MDLATRTDGGRACAFRGRGIGKPGKAWIIIVIIIRFEKSDFAGLARKRDMELGRVRGEYKMVSFYRVSSVISSPDPTQSKTGIVWGTRRVS